MDDILQRIVQQRREDLARRGPALGYPVPLERQRPVNPFLPAGGVILEIKRASPSRGAIAPDLDAVQTARTYIEAGAKAISILTEEHYFKGNLQDLLEVGKAFPHHPLLRKDFILTDDDIAVSYRAGADGVLLIARLFDTDTLLHLAEQTVRFGMKPLIEVREEEDLPKLRFVAERLPCLAGVNSRDLRTFTIDPLLPALRITELPVPAIYESGVQTPFQASYAAHLGYIGILVGEGAVRQKEQISLLIRHFTQTRNQLQGSSGLSGESPQEGISGSSLGDLRPGTGRGNRQENSALPAAGELWRRLAQRRAYRQSQVPLESHRYWRLGAPPLVKICGLTRLEDVQHCLALGADLLGFIFAPSPRKTDAAFVRQARAFLSSFYFPEGKGNTRDVPLPLFIGVITDVQSPAAQEALGLAQEGILDGIQYHGPLDEEALAQLPQEVGRYVVLPVSQPADREAYQGLQKRGEVRFLLDRRVGNQSGGTETPIQDEVLDALISQGPAASSSSYSPLWIAGGLGADTVGSLLSRYPVELVDASSRLETEPGKKDPQKLRAFFAAIAHPQGGKEEVPVSDSNQHKEYQHG